MLSMLSGYQGLTIFRDEGWRDAVFALELHVEIPVFFVADGQADSQRRFAFAQPAERPVHRDGTCRFHRRMAERGAAGPGERDDADVQGAGMLGDAGPAAVADLLVEPVVVAECQLLVGGLGLLGDGAMGNAYGCFHKQVANAL